MNERNRLVTNLHPRVTTPINPSRRSAGRGNNPSPPPPDTLTINDPPTGRQLPRSPLNPPSTSRNDLSILFNDSDSEPDIDLNIHQALNLNPAAPFEPQNIEIQLPLLVPQFQAPLENNPVNQVIVPQIQLPVIDMAFTAANMLTMLPDFKGDRDGLEQFLLIGDIIFQSFDNAVMSPHFLPIVKSKIHGACKGAVSSLATWAAIKAELQSSILPMQSVTELNQLLATTKQGRNQSARDYGNRMEQILTDLLAATKATVAEAGYPFFETAYRNQALNHFLYGLRDPLRTYVKAQAPVSLSVAREMATRDEPMLKPAPTPEMQPQQNTAWNLACYKCHQTGHSSDNCQMRVNIQPNRQNRNAKFPRPNQPNQVTCYLCHQVGHYANKCPTPTAQAQVKNEPINLVRTNCSYCKGPDHTIYDCQLRINANRGKPSCSYCTLTNHVESECLKLIADRQQPGTSNQASLNLLQANHPNPSTKNDLSSPSNVGPQDMDPRSAPFGSTTHHY